MTTKDFCIELATAALPNSTPEFYSQRIKTVFNEDITPEYISRYLDIKLINAEHNARESRKIEYSINSNNIFS